MRKTWRIFAVLSAFVTVVLAVSRLYADNVHERNGAMTGGNGMMGQMGRMHGMMEGCSRMMGTQGGHSEKPNDQWRKKTPEKPEKES